MSGIVLTEVADATIPAPPAGKVTVYMSTEEAGPAFKDDADVVTPLQGATGSTGPTGPGYGGTSTTSLAIGTGSRTFTTQSGRAYVAGTRVRAASDADPDGDWMEGVTTSYSGTSLVVLMDLISGSGTHTDWNLTLAGEQGPQGEEAVVLVYDAGNTGSAIEFDYADSGAQKALVDDDTTITITATGAAATQELVIALQLIMDGTPGHAITLGAGITVPTGTTFAYDDSASAVNLAVFWSPNGGTDWIWRPDGGPIPEAEDIAYDNATSGLTATDVQAAIDELAAAVAALVAGGGGIPQATTVRRTAGDLATSSTSFVDATSLTITLTTGAHRCLVVFSGMAQKSAWTDVFVDIDVDGTRVGGSNGLTGATINSASAYDQNLSLAFLTDVLSAASHTIKIQWRVNGGSATLFASATTPAVLSVIELPV